MTGLSQRTVALMVRILEKVCRRSSQNTLPILAIATLELDLYALGWERQVIEASSISYNWNFRKLLPEFLDGKFFVNLRASAIPAMGPRTYFETFDPYPSDLESGQKLLITVAEYICTFLANLPQHLPEYRRLRDPLISNLALDGLSLANGKLIPTDSAIVDQPKQVALLKQLLKECKLPNETIIFHHYDQGEELFTDCKWDPCVGQWRSFFEQLLRDIEECSSFGRSEPYARGSPMQDTLAYLVRIGFFDSDERTCVGAAYGFLCSGSHPGIGKEHKARLAMHQALVFGQILTLKFLNWRQNKYQQFSI